MQNLPNNMFIPYSRTEIRVCRFSDVVNNYTVEERVNIINQLINLREIWGGYLLETKLSRFWVCIIDKKAVNKLQAYADCVDEVDDAIKNNTPLVVAFLVLKKYVMRKSQFKFIKCIHTLVPKASFGSYIMYRVSKTLHSWFLPDYVIEDSVGFWKKYLGIHYGIYTKTDYCDFIIKHKLDGVISWIYIIKTLQ